METLHDLKNYSDGLKNGKKMPVLFLGHGNPMNAIEENIFVKGFRGIAGTMEKPSAIVCISAHWFTDSTKVTAMSWPKTIHDFSGFPEELYRVQYPAPGDPVLADQVKELMDPTPVELDPKWGLDHGAWSVIKHLYPQADVPVIQLSMDYRKGPQFHYKLGSLLGELRHKGILVIGSGNIVHNLARVDWQNLHKEDHGYDWAYEARERINRAITSGDYSVLLDFEKHSKALQLAIPTPDHFFPLLYILGIKEKNEDLSFFNDQLIGGSISMTSLKIGN